MSEKLNVCLMNDSFPPLIDGVANAVVNYASIIEQKYGHAIVCTPDYPDAKDDYPFEVLRYASLDTTKLVGYRTGMPVDLNFIGSFHDKNLDVIHTHCPIVSTYLARLVRDAIHKPVILTYHTKFDIDIRRTIDARIVQDVAINTLVRNIETADEVWCVSKGAGENLKSLGFNGDYIVMPNGVDFTKGAAPEEDIKAVKEAYNLPNDRPVFLFVGRMMWYKGIRIILDALRTLKDEGKNFMMLFVGGGGEIEEIQKYCSQLILDDDCKFIGAIHDRERLKAIFSACDLFLFPSSFDTNGIVVREAAASGLGSVLIKGSCAAEDVTDGRNALLIDENADSLAKLLLSLDGNREFMHMIGKNAQNELYMSWEHSVDMAVARYREVMAKFEYKKPSLLDDDSTLLDNMIRGFSHTANSLDIAKKSGEEISTKIFDLLDRWL